jgi:biotin carboxyl carrier protein
METEIRTRTGGIVGSIAVKVGETVASQDDLLTLE